MTLRRVPKTKPPAGTALSNPLAHEYGSSHDLNGGARIAGENGPRPAMKRIDTVTKPLSPDTVEQPVSPPPSALPFTDRRRRGLYEDDVSREGTNTSLSPEWTPGSLSTGIEPSALSFKEKRSLYDESSQYRTAVSWSPRASAEGPLGLSREWTSTTL